MIIRISTYTSDFLLCPVPKGRKKINLHPCPTTPFRRALVPIAIGEENKLIFDFDLSFR